MPIFGILEAETEDVYEPPDAPYVDFWAHLAFTGGDDLEPEIIEVLGDAVWWDSEQELWDSALFGGLQTFIKDGGCSFNISNQDSALREGIAPDQKFLVRMHRPTYTRDYWGEYDCDFDIEILHIEPLAAQEILRRWEIHFTDQKSYISETLQKNQEIREKQLVDFDSMYIQSVEYSSGRHWLDARRYGCNLLTKHRFWNLSNLLAHGEADERGLAMDRMIAKAITSIPGLTEERIRKMPITKDSQW
jgi:hypothetical protein